MLHVLEHHNERVAVDTHAVEGDDVLVLEVGEELRLSVEVSSAALAGLLQSLKPKTKTKSNVKELHLNAASNIDFSGGGGGRGQLPGRYLDCHMYLLLVRCQVVALSKKDLPEGSLSQLPLQDDVVPLDVLDDCREPEPDTDTVTPTLLGQRPSVFNCSLRNTGLLLLTEETPVLVDTVSDPVKVQQIYTRYSFC